MFHRSERLFLRPPWPEDWQAILAAIAEEAIVRNLGGAPWPYGEEDARERANAAQHPRVPNFLLFLPGADGAELVGSAGLGERHGGIELGYWIARKFWGQGFASEAARAVLDIALLCGHREIVAGHFLDNPASGRVLEKIGFVATGEVSPRHSAGRGGEAPCKHYAIRLAAPPCLGAKAA